VIYLKQPEKLQLRHELRDFDWHCYGLGLSDIDYTISIVRNVQNDRELLVRQRWDKVREENPAHVDDIMGDVSYYTWVENQYFWAFCLWRMQAIFEGIITKSILPNMKRMSGLRSKIKAVRDAGYTVESSIENDLLEWAELRNALSHCPPEQHRPVSLMEEDLLEYRDLLVNTLSTWKGEGAPVRD
jgi:hypothetical protein